MSPLEAAHSLPPCADGPASWPSPRRAELSQCALKETEEKVHGASPGRPVQEQRTAQRKDENFKDGLPRTQTRDFCSLDDDSAGPERTPLILLF